MLLLLLLLLPVLPVLPVLSLLTLLRLTTLLLAAVTATRYLSAAEPVCNGESDLRAFTTETRAVAHHRMRGTILDPGRTEQESNFS